MGPNKHGQYTTERARRRAAACALVRGKAHPPRAPAGSRSGSDPASYLCERSPEPCASGTHSGGGSVIATSADTPVL